MRTLERECYAGTPLSLSCVRACVHVRVRVCVCVCGYAQVCNLWTSGSIFTASVSLPVHGASIGLMQMFVYFLPLIRLLFFCHFTFSLNGGLGEVNHNNIFLCCHQSHFIQLDH